MKIMTKILNVENFYEETQNGVVLVDFFANWCAPCKMIAPVIDELANELDNVKVFKVDIDQSMELGVEFKIKSIPTFLFFKDGVVVDKLMGVNDKQIFIDKLNSL